MRRPPDAATRTAPVAPVYVALVGAALALAIASGRPEPLLAAVPPAVGALWGLSAAPRARLRARVEVEPARVAEGGRAELKVHLQAEAAGGPVFVAVRPAVGPGCELEPAVAVARLSPGAPAATLAFALTARRRGVHALGRVHLTAFAPAGLVAEGHTAGEPRPWEVLPAPAAPWRVPLARPSTSLVPGAFPARAAGTGLDFRGLRPLVPGDTLRDLDWRATARWRRWLARERHAQRSAEAVVLLDALASHGGAAGDTLEACVRAAAGIALRLLAAGMRVGLVCYGGVLDWLAPGSGRPHAWALLRRLRDVEVVATYVTKDLRLLPRRVLPPRATVLAVTSLVDPRFAAVLADLRGRGFDVVVAYVPPGDAVPARHPAEQVALRLWSLEQRMLLDRLAAAGVAVLRWPEELARPPAGTAARRGRGRRRAGAAARWVALLAAGLLSAGAGSAAAGGGWAGALLGALVAEWLLAAAHALAVAGPAGARVLQDPAFWGALLRRMPAILAAAGAVLSAARSGPAVAAGPVGAAAGAALLAASLADLARRAGVNRGAAA